MDFRVTNIIEGDPYVLPTLFCTKKKAIRMYLKKKKKKKKKKHNPAVLN